MSGEAMEAAARAVLHRRIKPDFFEVKDGAWTIDHDKVIAEAAVAAYLSALPDAPAEMPGVEEIARAIYESQGFAYDGKTVLADGTPYAEWAKAVSGARAVLALFAPILAEKERAELALCDLMNAAGHYKATHSEIDREALSATIKAAAAHLEAAAIRAGE